MIIDLEQLAFVDPKLREIATGFEDETGLTMTVTSIYRIGDDGVHGQLPVRGLDWRCRSFVLGNFIAGFINKRWVYDPARPEKKVCTCHEVDGKGLHLHLQAHPDTERR